MKNYIGIDLGTSGVKILLVRADGVILNEITESYPVLYPRSGWTEQNPEDWVNATVRGLKRLKADNVAGISFGGQMHGLVVLDKDDNVIRPCILWNDGRTDKQTQYLNDTVGKEKLASLTANIAFAGFTAPKILWLKENEPYNFKQIAKIMLPKDYLVYKLTGSFCTDYSDASGTLLLDVKNKRWSTEMLDICGITEKQLPKLCESYQSVGKLKNGVSSLFGFKDVYVMAGAGDNAAAAIGTGTVGNGMCNISLGTSGTVFISTDNFVMPKNNALHSFNHANGKWHLMGCILSAASANRWWVEDITEGNYDLPANTEKLLGKNDVYFLPYLSGERCPHNNPNVRGAFLNLSANTTRQEMSLAVLEGVAFALRDCLELAGNIKITKSTICGGGAKSALWKKIISDILNVDLYGVETEQGPAFGAAILAMVGCGEYENIDIAVKALIKKEKLCSPDKDTVSFYETKYKIFKKLYPSIKDFDFKR